MSLFGNAVPNSRDFLEGIVLGVDTPRKCCKVRTDFGQAMSGVRWLDDAQFAFGDRVLITTATGTAIILGKIPAMGRDKEFAARIDTGEVESDTGNYSTLSRGLVLDEDKPGDLIAEDKLWFNKNGGVLGLLRTGTIVLKSSRLAQIFISKYDDLVRVVARNYELFTDICTKVIANVRGRAYEYKGYGDTPTNARGDIYKYDEAYGDTVLGNLLKGNYYGYTPGTFSALAASNDIIKTARVLSSGGDILYKQEVHLTGQNYQIAQNSAGTAYTYVDQTNATFDVKTLNSTYARITTTPTSAVITYNGTSTATINATNIVLNFNNVSVVTLNSSGITMTFGGHSLTMDGTGIHTV